MAYLELRGLRQTFGAVTALDGLDMSLREGELVALLGPSGCGKTTALRIVAGFQRPTSGTVTLAGRDVTGLPPRRRDFGMVFQSYSLFPHLTALENVAFGLRLRRTSRSESRNRAGWLLAMVGLRDAADRYPHQLSGGMQQRVALARALATQPRLLLLDEPLSALDARVRVQLREEIRRVQSELGITTLYVTHDQEEALSTADRVAVLNRGRIEQIDRPDGVYRRPATAFVADFIGTINRLPGTVADSGGTVHVKGVPIHVHGARSRSRGSEILVLVRPESLNLERLNGHTPTGALPAAVTARHFLGSVTRVKARTPHGLELRADVPSDVSGWLVPGVEVVARFDPNDARVLDAGA